MENKKLDNLSEEQIDGSKIKGGAGRIRPSRISPPSGPSGPVHPEHDPGASHFNHEGDPGVHDPLNSHPGQNPPLEPDPTNPHPRG